MKRVALVFLVFLCVSILYGQDFRGTAALDTNRLLIGDQTNLSMSFTFPVKTKVQWPAIADTILGYLQVIDRSPIDTSLSQDKKWMTLHQTLRITSFDSGLYTIPPIRLYFREIPDTTLRYIQTESLILNVHTVSVDTTREIKPIKGLMKVPLTFREVLPWILLVILSGIIVWFIWYYLKKRKKEEPLFTLKPRVVLKPHEIALSELEKLRVKKLWQSGRIKEFHTEVTDIIRKYLEDRFSIMAMESITDEILDDIRRHPAAPEKQVYDKLFQILTLADLVKFAKAHPLPAENEQSLQFAVDIVNFTIPGHEETIPEKNKEE